MAYELLRESRSIRKRAAQHLEQFQLLARERGADASEMPLPTRDEFTRNHSACVTLMLISMAIKGFSETVWQELRGKDRHAFARGLRDWCHLSKALKSVGVVTAAVQYIKIKPRHEVADPLGLVEEKVDLFFGPSDRLDFENSMALMIDPSAEDKIILEGVAAYLSNLRKSGVKPAKVVSSRGGRNPNTCQPELVLQAIGLTRLAYHLPAKTAWELIYPKRATTATNVEIKRARELCRAAMHHHFELPAGETPIHFKSRTTKAGGVRNRAK